MDGEDGQGVSSLSPLLLSKTGRQSVFTAVSLFATSLVALLFSQKSKGRKAKKTTKVKKKA